MKSTKVPGPEIGYSDLIDYVIQKDQKENDRPKTFPLRPSAAGYCARRLAYDLHGYLGKGSYEQELNDPNVSRLLDLGNSIEWHAIKYFNKIGKAKYKQQVVTLFALDDVNGKPQPLIEGSIDFVVIVNDWKGMGDVKSKKDGFSAFYKTKWDETIEQLDSMPSLQKLSDTAWYADDLDAFVGELKDQFFIDNFIQLNSYLNTPFAKERGIDHGFIYRYCKNDSRHIEIRFKPSATLFEKVKEKFNRVNTLVQLEGPEAVERDHALGSIKCAFCPYSKYCYPNQDSKKEYFKTWPKRAWPTDITRINSLKLRDLFLDYEDLMKTRQELEVIEQEIVRILNEKKELKVKLDNGNVYEVKYLKTGGPGNGPRLTLRRTKL